MFAGRIRFAALAALIGSLAGGRAAIPERPETPLPPSDKAHDLARIAKAGNKRRRKAEARLRRL